MKKILFCLNFLLFLGYFGHSQNILSGAFVEGASYNDIIPDFTNTIDAKRSQTYTFAAGYTFRFTGYGTLNLDISSVIDAKRVELQGTKFSFGLKATVRWYPFYKLNFKNPRYF